MEGAPLTLGQALAAKARLIVWCKACQHKVDPDVVEQVKHYGEAATVADWGGPAALLECDARETYFAVFHKPYSRTLRERRYRICY